MTIIIIIIITIEKNEKMSEQETKYYKFKSSGSGQVTIPITIARMMGWKHDDILKISFENINGNKGIFLYKEDNKERD